MYSNDHRNDNRASERGVGDDSISKHFMFKWYRKCKFYPKRRSVAIYLFMDKQCYHSKHHKPSSGFLHGDGSRCERLYGSIHGHSSNDFKSTAGTDFEYYGYYDINVYEPNDSTTSNRRSNLQLEWRCNATE
jgi:hypothetical protein